MDRGLWYNNRANEAELPFSPCRNGAQRLICSSFEGTLACGVFASRDFLFCRAGPGNWRYPSISNAKDMLITEDIREKEVRLIGEDGEQLGIVTSATALKMAYDRGLDLVMMSAQATPPVCRIMDYGKYRFDREKKEKEAKKKQQTIELKEVQLSCRIDTHDFETKARNAQKFLAAGNKVRVVVRFKGREMAHQELGRDVLTRFEQAMAPVGVVEKKPVLDGRILSMVVVPIKATPTKK